MFCPKCGAKMIESAEFCQKCGAKVVHTDDSQQPRNTTPIVEPQKAVAEAPPIIENTQRTPKANSGLRNAAIIGRILMWGSTALWFLMALEYQSASFCQYLE